MVNTEPLLKVENLSTVFVTDEGTVTVVDNVSFSLDKGKVLGIVGESGCGKTITALSVLRLLPPAAKITAGSVELAGQKLLTLNNEQMRLIRGDRIALIPQDPLTSLNPVYTIGNQILEVIELHQKLNKKDAVKRALEVLDQVRIPNAKRIMENYPHELSGGMRQRVIIAMALSCKPELLIADEPTTALDVTVQAQILNLIRGIQKEEGMSLLLITHDLGVIAEMCDDVIVMYAGQVVEYADVVNIFKDPLHPYTRGLLNSLPGKSKERLYQVEGQPPGMYSLPEGCYFEPRCDSTVQECKNQSQKLITLPDNRKVRCFLSQG